jgi:hypothetical protein
MTESGAASAMNPMAAGEAHAELAPSAPSHHPNAPAPSRAPREREQKAEQHLEQGAGPGTAVYDAELTRGLTRGAASQRGSGGRGLSCARAAPVLAPLVRCAHASGAAARFARGITAQIPPSRLVAVQASQLGAQPKLLAAPDLAPRRTKR